MKHRSVKVVTADATIDGAAAADDVELGLSSATKDRPDHPSKVQFRYVVNGDDSSAIVENAPVENVDNSRDPRYMGTWVAEVAVAHPNGDVIRKYQGQYQRLQQV
jgi:hypothetical protein